ncbi:S1C family serine protease [Bacillus sp. V33-4]|uniref:S1C family serine protease n=1 Tax=Bacillus sp. V33-4 TaxID=2054169 RepID=UPI000C7877DB|nr:trypsin-like peptidase domain-containing protein [Bacillus sp. V33-4]PLR85175.1 peptidase S1 [Bacillus sp. V33-4]
MTDFNEINSHENDSSKEKKISGKSKIKNVFSLLSAGVAGSMLTLTLAANTDLLQTLDLAEDRQAAANNEKTETEQGASNIVPASAQNSSTSIADIVETSSKAIVGIVNLQGQQGYFENNRENAQRGSGSGVIFKKDKDSAYIVTNNHVIEAAEEIEISLYNGEKTTAELIGADALTDLAVLKMDAKYADSVIKFGDSSTLRPGDQVLAIGNPLGLDLSRTVTQGIVSAVDRSISVPTSAGEWDLNVIQTDAAINPGNSGGALINTQGEVIGINSLKISQNGIEGLGFAIPSNDLLPIVEEIIENGKVERPYLGVGLANLEEIPRSYLKNVPDSVTKGAIVANIDPDSAAAEAGLQVEDVIVAINDTEVTNSKDLRKYLYTNLKVGDKIELKVYQEGSLKTIPITLTSNN